MSELMTKIERIMDSPIRDVNRLIASGYPWMTALEARFDLKKGQNWFRIRPETNDCRHHVFRRLGHIIVSPKDPLNTAALKQCYVFHHKKGYVNSTRKAALKLIKSLINVAQDYHYRKFPHHKPPKFVSNESVSPTILRGPRGSGKSFFHNYIFTEYSDLLDKEKVIWVRLNLVRDFGDNRDLVHWILAQITKIVVRYYDDKSFLYRGKNPPLNLRSKLYDYFNEEYRGDPEMRFEYKARVDAIWEEFKSEKLDERISPGLIPRVIGRKVYELAENEGYSFIIVLDGFDRLEAIPRYKKKFEHLYNASADLTQGDDIFHAAFLFIVRKVTYDNMILEGHHTSPFRPGLHEDCELVPVPIEKIVDQRLKYIEEELDKKARSIRGSIGSQTDCIKVREELASFRSHLWSGKGGQKTLTKIDDTHQDSNRAKMETLQLLYHEFYISEMEKPYTLTESLLLGGHPFPPNEFVYRAVQSTQRSRKGKKTKITIDRGLGRSGFDVHFLPPIYLFPWAKLRNGDSVVFPRLHGFLAGMRMLQIMTAQSLLPGKKLLARELALICGTLFGYDKDMIVHMVEEFGDFDLFYLTGISFPTPSTAHKYSIQVLPKANFILRHLADDVAYLNLCSMNIPFRKDCMSQKNTPFIRAASRSDEIRKWIVAKMLNSLSMYRLIRTINDLQYEKYLGCVGKLNYEFKGICDTAVRSQDDQSDGMFSFIHKMRKQVVRQFKNILNEIELWSPVDRENMLKELSSELDRYEYRWAGPSQPSTGLTHHPG